MVTELSTEVKLLHKLDFLMTWAQNYNIKFYF